MADDNLMAGLTGFTEGVRDVLVPYLQGNIEEKRKRRLLQEQFALQTQQKKFLDPFELEQDVAREKALLEVREPFKEKEEERRKTTGIELAKARRKRLGQTTIESLRKSDISYINSLLRQYNIQIASIKNETPITEDLEFNEEYQDLTLLRDAALEELRKRTPGQPPSLPPKPRPPKPPPVQTSKPGLFDRVSRFVGFGGRTPVNDGRQRKPLSAFENRQ